MKTQTYLLSPFWVSNKRVSPHIISRKPAIPIKVGLFDTPFEKLNGRNASHILATRSALQAFWINRSTQPPSCNGASRARASWSPLWSLNLILVSNQFAALRVPLVDQIDKHYFVLLATVYSFAKEDFE
jgi:hypothetical protein